MRMSALDQLVEAFAEQKALAAREDHALERRYRRGFVDQFAHSLKRYRVARLRSGTHAAVVAGRCAAPRCDQGKDARAYEHGDLARRALGRGESGVVGDDAFEWTIEEAAPGIIACRDNVEHEGLAACI